MSLYEEGYLFEGRSHFGLTMKYWGNISFIDDKLVFFGKNERQIEIPLNSIRTIEQRKAVVHFTLNDDKIWTFFCSPRKSSSSMSLGEIMACRRKAQNMASLIKYLKNR